MVKFLLRDGCILHQETTHIDRNHMITMTSGSGLLMLANEHFEPNSTLRERRVRLRTILRTTCAAGLGVLIGDLNICDPGW